MGSEALTTWIGLAPAVAGLLLTYAFHSTLLLGAAWLACGILPRSSRALREMLWRTALLGGLLSTALQGSQLIAPLAGWIDLVRENGGRSPEEENGSTPGHSVAANGSTVAAVGVSVWVLGALAGLARLVVLRRRFHRRLGLRRPCASAGAQRRLERLGRRAGLRRILRLTESESIFGPVALGASEICVPTGALARLTWDQQQSLLAHELAHLIRRDPFWLTLGGAIESLFFFQPLNRVARRALQEEAEFACDAWAVARTADRLALAECLAEVARWIHGRTIPAASLTSSPSTLVQRIQAVLDEETRVLSHPPRFIPATMAAGLLAGVVFLAPHLILGRGAGSGQVDAVPFYHVNATDPAGEFTLDIRESRVVSATIDGLPVPPERLVQRGTTLTVLTEQGTPAFEIEIKPRGGIRWRARPARPWAPPPET